MSAIFFLIGCSVLIALLFLGAFIWANKSGQHDDTYTPAIRVLFEDDFPSEEKELDRQVNLGEENK
ncbi:cbb3-type cytochrome oxidase assembly protein CcoS [Olivibacter sp. XZL3]|uniref:cbb3-type cytochrome oxidase assembly protein CcoS n=1 Tax=Olivibacter sp. XZL3 TaxID=1735116 RepID=UPI00106665F8|nr:cbb3-type cytochrome oxidase assembly protein CcoS [Olivibacter sp. XZL3]